MIGALWGVVGLVVLSLSLVWFEIFKTQRELDQLRQVVQSILEHRAGAGVSEQFAPVPPPKSETLERPKRTRKPRKPREPVQSDLVVAVRKLDAAVAEEFSKAGVP